MTAALARFDPDHAALEDLVARTGHGRFRILWHAHPRGRAMARRLAGLAPDPRGDSPMAATPAARASWPAPEDLRAAEGCIHRDCLGCGCRGCRCELARTLVTIRDCLRCVHDRDL